MVSKKVKTLQDYKILSVGGSIIIPPGGFDIEFLKKFRELVLSKVKEGMKFILVIGGGATCRQYQRAAQSVVRPTSQDLDWLGIKSTVFNAEFVKLLFKNQAHSEVIINPTIKAKTGRPILVAGGWRPGTSTDGDAVLLAKTYGAKEIINLSNIDYVYDSDPRANPGAKKLERLGWKELRKIVGDKWTPGANVPFDPVAAKRAERLKLVVKFVKGTDLDNLTKALEGGNILGSIIYPKSE